MSSTRPRRRAGLRFEMRHRGGQLRAASGSFAELRGARRRGANLATEKVASELSQARRDNGWMSCPRSAARRAHTPRARTPISHIYQQLSRDTTILPVTTVYFKG